MAGYDRDDIDDVELLALENDPRNCFNDLPNFPLALHGATGAFVDGEVRVCGGYDGTYFNECYDFNPSDGSWDDGEPMLEERYEAASSVIGGEWFITGGRVCTYIRYTILKFSCLFKQLCDVYLKDSRGDLPTTEIWDGDSFRSGPSLPVSMAYHCQVTLNSTHVFLADTLDTRFTYILDWRDFTYVQMESLYISFTTGPCGLATSDSKGQEIVVSADGLSVIFTCGEADRS